MATIKKFEDLEIWQLARKLCLEIYELTLREKFLKDYSLKDQIRASSGSIMDNIAEGFERGGNKEFKQFLSIAKGSSGETKSQLYRAYDRKYLNENELKEYLEKIYNLAKKISNMMSYLSHTTYKGQKFKDDNFIYEPE
jgi:four helix bundle protein